MGLYTEKYTSPFDNIDDRQSINATPRASHIKPPKYLSTRSALFMGMAIISLNLGMHLEENAWFVMASAVVFFIFWGCTFRFITKKSLLPFLCFIYMLFFGAIQYLFKDIVSFKYIFAMIPFSLGLMTLTAANKDGAEEYRRPESITECVIPFLYAIASSLVAYYINGLFEVQYFFSMLLISVVFLMVLSWILTKGTKSPYFFTSKRLSELWDIPVSNSDNVKLFCISKGIFALTTAIATVACFVSVYFIKSIYPEIVNIIPMPIISVVMLISIYIVFAFGPNPKSLFGTRFFVYEAFLATASLSAPFEYKSDTGILVVVLFYVMTLFVDIVITAVFAVIRRQQIFVSKSKYVDGLPFMMVFVSLFVMLMECCLYQVSPL